MTKVMWLPILTLTWGAEEMREFVLSNKRRREDSVSGETMSKKWKGKGREVGEVKVMQLIGKSWIIIDKWNPVKWME